MNRYKRHQAHIDLTDLPSGRIGLRFYADDSRDWHAILDTFKATFPAHADRSYSQTARQWSVPRLHADRLRRWLLSTFDLGAIDSPWWGQAYTHYDDRSGKERAHEPPQARTPLSTLSEAYRTLHLADDAPLSVVEAAYQALAKQAHPDAGGGHEAQKAINSAVALIRDAQARRTGAA